MKSVIAVLAMCVVATSAVHLTPDNFDELSAGKAVFLKVRQRKREGARGTCTEICSGVDTMRRVDADEALFVAPLRSSPPPWIMFPHWPDSHLTLSHLNSLFCASSPLAALPFPSNLTNLASPLLVSDLTNLTLCPTALTPARLLVLRPVVRALQEYETCLGPTHD